MLHTVAQTYNYDDTLSPTATSFDANGLGLILLIMLPFILVMIAAMWRVFQKAGKPGWASIVPIYNMVVELEIVGRPTWWVLFLLLGFIPFLGAIITLVLGVIISHDLAKSFGKDIGYTLLLIFLPFIGYPMLAWGKATYQGPSAGGVPPTAPTPPNTPTYPTPPSNTPIA